MFFVFESSAIVLAHSIVRDGLGDTSRSSSMANAGSASARSNRLLLCLFIEIAWNNFKTFGGEE
jgi:hypothetical protein